MLNVLRSKNSCEEEAKFIQERIQFTEKSIAVLCHIFSQYMRKAARLRDKGDVISKEVLIFASNENINKSLTNGLENFADVLSILSDYGDARVQMLDNKVVSQFAKYEDICKQAKEEVKEIFCAREKEINRRRQLDRTRERNPRNRQQIVQAEAELVKATAEVSKTMRNIEDKTNTFEKQKLHDIKSILLDFITIELGYHAKAIEILTKAFNETNVINEELDLEDFQKVRGKMDMDFKKSLRVDFTQSSISKKSIFRSTQSLGALGAIFSTSHNKRSPGIFNPKEKLNKSEETLDSMKHNLSDEEDSDDSATSSDLSNIGKNTSPKMRAYRN